MSGFMEMKELLALRPLIELDGNLAWFQDHVDADVEQVLPIVQDEVVYGRMATIFPLVIRLKDGAEKKLMVKRVVPSELSPKEGLDVFLKSVQTEIRFYQENCIGKQFDLFPKVYQVFERHAKDGVEPGFLVVMQDLRQLGYFHIKMTEDEARVKQALTSFIRLFANVELSYCLSMFNKRADLSKEELDHLRGGFWVLCKRPNEEVDNAEKTWASFLGHFGPELETIVPDRDKLATLGPRLGRVAGKLNDIVREHCFAYVHGDSKSWNLFFASDMAKPVVLIDFQWKGLGHPLQDFCYYMTTSVAPELLERKWDDLVTWFRNELDQALRDQSQEYRQVILCDSLAAFQDLAEIIWLDYARVIVLGLWARLDPERLASNEQKIGISLVTSSMEQIKYIVKTAIRRLDKHDE